MDAEGGGCANHHHAPPAPKSPLPLPLGPMARESRRSARWPAVYGYTLAIRLYIGYTAIHWLYGYTLAIRLYIGYTAIHWLSMYHGPPCARIGPMLPAKEKGTEHLRRIRSIGVISVYSGYFSISLFISIYFYLLDFGRKMTKGP